ncbi:MAG: hypothetical protein Q7R51_02640 [bacterium]|nr:hypothetical protein [bacterium]
METDRRGYTEKDLYAPKLFERFLALRGGVDTFLIRGEITSSCNQVIWIARFPNFHGQGQGGIGAGFIGNAQAPAPFFKSVANNVELPDNPTRIDLVLTFGDNINPPEEEWSEDMPDAGLVLGFKGEEEQFAILRCRANLSPQETLREIREALDI